MKKHSVVIIDDEANARERLESILLTFEQIQVVANFKNTMEALESVPRLNPDILFVDIEMPGKNGIELVKELRNYKIDPTIVFITGYDKYAVEAFRVSAFDYLLKPIIIADLADVISKYEKEKEKENFRSKIDRICNFLGNHQKLKIKSKEGVRLLPFNEIVYCEADGNYTIIQQTSGNIETSSQLLKEIEAQLPAEGFFRISRSAIINLNFVTELNRKKKICNLRDDKTEYCLKVSRTEFKKLEERV